MKKIFSFIAVAALLVFAQTIFAANYSYYSQGVQRGVIKGAYPTYTNDTYVSIKTGYGECNGHYFEVTSDIDLEISGGSPSGEDFYYIYVNDSNDNYPTLDNTSFYDSTTEPAWSDDKQGWYNSNDRCIGSVWIDGNNEILQFTVVDENKIIYTGVIGLQYNGNPNDTWQNTAIDADTVTPVFACALKLNIYGTDSTANVCVAAKSVSTTDWIGGWGFRNLSYCQWLVTGTTDRSVLWYGADNDNNVFQVELYGYQIQR